MRQLSGTRIGRGDVLEVIRQMNGCLSTSCRTIPNAVAVGSDGREPREERWRVTRSKARIARRARGEMIGERRHRIGMMYSRASLFADRYDILR